MKTVNKKSKSAYLPKGWQNLKIKQLAKKVTAGGTPRTQRAEFWGGNIPWMNSGEINLKKIDSVSGRITQLGLKESAAKMIPPYSILIALAGQGKTRGTVAINMIKLCTNQSLAAIITNDKILPYYLYHNLDFRYKELRAYSTGDGGRGGLNLTIINNIKINFPENKKEQKRIVEVFSTWDQAIEKLENLISAKQKQFKWLLKTLITDQQDNPSWKKVKLDDICKILKGKGLSKNSIIKKGKNKCILYGELYTVYSEIIKKIVSRTDVDDGVLSNAGDILIPGSTTTQGVDLANATALFESGVLLGSDINILRLKNNKLYDSSFLSYYLTYGKRREITSYTQGITIVHLYGKFLKNLSVSLPTFEKQKKITKILNTAQQEIELLKSSIEQYRTQKKGLMQKLLTGKIRLQ